MLSPSVPGNMVNAAPGNPVTPLGFRISPYGVGGNKLFAFSFQGAHRRGFKERICEFHVGLPAYPNQVACG